MELAVLGVQVAALLIEVNTDRHPASLRNYAGAGGLKHRLTLSCGTGKEKLITDTWGINS